MKLFLKITTLLSGKWEYACLNKRLSSPWSIIRSSCVETMAPLLDKSISDSPFWLTHFSFAVKKRTAINFSFKNEKERGSSGASLVTVTWPAQFHQVMTPLIFFLLIFSTWVIEWDWFLLETKQHDAHVGVEHPWNFGTCICCLRDI